MLRIRYLIITAAFLVFARWALPGYLHSTIHPEFLVYGQSAPSRADADLAKGQTAWISIDNPHFVVPIATGHPAIVDNFQVFAGPGTIHNEARSLIIDWTSRQAFPKSELERYQVSFHLAGYARPYVVWYAFAPSSKQGYVYLPGKEDESYRNNQAIISRGVEGSWFLALKSWEDVARPLIARQITRTTVLTLAKACISKSPNKFRSIWGSPLDFDKVHFGQLGPDRMSLYISENRPRGAPEGLAIGVNVKTGQCVRLGVE